MNARRHVASRGIVCAALAAGLVLAGRPQQAAAQSVPDCASPTAGYEIQFTGGWCYVSQQGYFHNPYLGWAYDANRRLVYEYASGVYYSLDSGWMYGSQTGLYYHSVANWLYEPRTRLVYDYNSGVIYSPDTGWLYEPQRGVFYQPSSGAYYSPQAAQIRNAQPAGSGYPRTGNGLLDQLLGAASDAVSQNQAFIAQLPQDVGAGNLSIFSPVGQGLAGVNSAMRNLGGALRGEISAAEISRQFRVSNALNAGQSAVQSVSNEVFKSQLASQQNAIAHQAETDAWLLQMRGQQLLPR